MRLKIFRRDNKIHIQLRKRKRKPCAVFSHGWGDEPKRKYGVSFKSYPPRKLKLDELEPWYQDDRDF